MGEKFILIKGMASILLGVNTYLLRFLTSLYLKQVTM